MTRFGEISPLSRDSERERERERGGDGGGLPTS